VKGERIGLTDAEFQTLLADLRAVRTDHQSVEAKRAGNALPDTTQETLSAFANREGGTLVLGLDEQGGAFVVTGIANVQRVQESLQALCAEMEPPLRPIISVVEAEGKQLVVAEIAPVPPHLRPCHRRPDGEYDGSYIRVGDGDQKMSRDEVDELRAQRSGLTDFSARPVPGEMRLDEGLFKEFAERARALPRNEDLTDDRLRQRYRIVSDEGPLTIAAALAMAEDPDARLGAASITFRVLPGESEPEETRFAGRHLEGTLGELLDQAMVACERELRTWQVADETGNLRDELEVPREALREIIANALLHRSFSPTQEQKTVLIEIGEAAVVVTSPGGLYSGADLTRLGLDSIAGVRNLTLVRICELLRTRDGARIVEHQASGIATADAVCHTVGVMPPLFIDMPTTFQAVFLRARPSLRTARETIEARGVTPTEEQIRLVGVAQGLETERATSPGLPLTGLVLDARLAARALAPYRTEDAARVIGQLEDARVLVRRSVRHTPFWVLNTQRGQAAEPGRSEPKAAAKSGGGNQLFALLEAIDSSPDKRLSPKGIGEALGISSTSTRKKWIDRALDAGWVESDSENIFDRTRTFSLTPQGKSALAGHKKTA
jgi:ATP-dependent DNA helicase RecG